MQRNKRFSEKDHLFEILSLFDEAYNTHGISTSEFMIVLSKIMKGLVSLKRLTFLILKLGY